MNDYSSANGIIDVRVDDRMIHGIVSTQWIPQYKATRAMVVNESASKNDMIRSAMKMAVPPGVALSCISPSKAIANFQINKYERQRVFVVGREIVDIYSLFRGGVKFKRVNLGDITQNEKPTLVLDKTVRVSEEEKSMLREMRDAGILIHCQFRPDDSIINCTTVLD